MGASRANMLYLAARTHNRAAVVYTRLMLQLCGSSGPTGYPRKHRSYDTTSNPGGEMEFAMLAGAFPPSGGSGTTLAERERALSSSSASA